MNNYPIRTLAVCKKRDKVLPIHIHCHDKVEDNSKFKMISNKKIFRFAGQVHVDALEMTNQPKISLSK